MPDKVKYGVRKVHYATMTTSGYATPVAMPGAVALTLTPNGEMTPYFADDIRYFMSVADNGYDMSLEITYVPESFLSDCLGMTKDSNGVIVEKSNVQPRPFALLFEEEGDVEGTKFVMYNCIATRPTRQLNTTTENITPQTQSVTISAMPLDNNKVMGMTSSTTATATVEGWYSEVYEG